MGNDGLGCVFCRACNLGQVWPVGSPVMGLLVIAECTHVKVSTKREHAMAKDAVHIYSSVWHGTEWHLL
jgi:hypothetical protein